MIISLWIKNFENHVETLLNFSEGFNLIAGPSNSGKCITGDTEIIQEDGSIKTVLDMFNDGKWKVPSLSNNKKILLEDVSCICANGDKKVYRLKTRRGMEIKSTSNHKFLTSDGWKELKDISDNDFIAIPRKLPFFGKNKMPKGHAMLLGLLLGDGHVGKGSLGFTNEENEVLEYFKYLVKLLGDHKFLEYKKKGRNCFTINVSKPDSCTNRHMGKSGLHKFCDDYGIKGSIHNNKKIPDIIFESSENDIKDVILGLLITDGWIHKRKSGGAEIGFCSTSKAMMKQVQHLLLRFGIMSTFREKKTSFKYGGKTIKGIAYCTEVTGKIILEKFLEVFGSDFIGKKSHKLKNILDCYVKEDYICRYDLYPKNNELISTLNNAIDKSKMMCKDICIAAGLISDHTDIRGKNKNKTFSFPLLKKVAKVLNNKKLNNLINSDIYWDRVKNIEYVGIEPTFDLDVPNTKCFVANNIITHNSSILRALRLIAYNEWDPRSLRIGAKNAEVKIVTERGSVLVKRGSKNEWTITKNGEESQIFGKPGKKILPEAAEIIGLNVVQFGNHSVRPNIMDQLEGHFMLAEVEGDNVSGSTRAQIIDEISGLAGMEELIRQVSLDNTRNSREINQNEATTKSLNSQKHDQAELDNKKVILDSVEELISLFGVKIKKKGDVNSIYEQINKIVSQIDIDIASSNKFPDCDAIIDSLDKAKEIILCTTNVSEIILSHSDMLSDLTNLNKTEFPDFIKLKEVLDKAEECSDSYSDINEKNKQYFELKEEYDGSKSSLNKSTVKLVDAEKELNESVKEIDICPICLGPVHEGCGAFCK